MNPLCIYHANCTDGFGAAWAVYRFFKRGGIPVDLLPASYGDAPPDVTDREVYIVDFSYKRDVLLAMGLKAQKITIIDHHKTSKEDLDGIEEHNPRIRAVFDMAHSGAVLTWSTLFHIQTCPQLLRYIEDRDLWKFKLANTRPVLSALNSYEQQVEIWDMLITKNISDLVVEGEAIERMYQKDLRSLMHLKMMGRIDGHLVPVANVPGKFASDIGNMILNATDDCPFSATYYDTPEGRKFSLRSTDDDMDVEPIAKKFGGGGHRNAAGFFISNATMDYREIEMLSGAFLINSPLPLDTET